MKKKYALLVMFLVAVLLPKQTLAQANRTWVSGVGDDANPCSRTAPCKTFAGAISKTAANGEISVLDPGGFGAVTITKSVTLNGDGTLAGILSASTNGIIISGDDIIVTIRSISINGAGTGLNGIKFINGAQVHVENCTINGMAAPIGSNGNGILVEHTTKGILTVKNTTITGPVSTMNGISVKTSSVTASDSIMVLLDNVHIQGLGTAIVAKDKARINLVNSFISNNTVAIFPEIAGSIIRLSNNSIFTNDTGIAVGPGKVISFGNNQIIGNPTSAPPATVSSSQ